MSGDEVMGRLRNSYNDPQLGGLRGALRRPDSSYTVGRNLNTAQAFSLLQWWGNGGWPNPFWPLYTVPPAKNRK